MIRGKLGKAPATEDERDFKFSTLIEMEALQLVVPPRFGHGRMFPDWQMLGNGPDETVVPGFSGAGNCVFAGGAHETMESAKLGGHTVRFTGKNVIDDYSAVTGYVVNNPATDNGTIVRDALKYRQKVGLIDMLGRRHKIGAYVSVDPKNFDQLMQAAWVFSAVGIGFNFPDTAWDQFDHDMPFDVVDDAKIEGGHYVPVFGRSSRSVCGVVTWGRRVGMTRDFYETYNDETWAMVYPEELRNGVNERGFDMTRLNDALLQLRG